MGEDLACEFLKKINYEILARNFNTNKGEIDIIAKQKDEYVFIEVKTRQSKVYGEAVEAVNNIKQKHIIEASKYYIYVNSLENQKIRFDIIEVYVNSKNNFINHIKNVFF